MIFFFAFFDMEKACSLVQLKNYEYDEEKDMF